MSRRRSASVRVEALDVVVLAPAESAGGRLGPRRRLCCRCPVRRCLLVWICKGVGEGAQVLTVTILTVREVGLHGGGFAHVLSRCGCRCESQRSSSWSGWWRRDSLWGVLVPLGCAKTVTKLRRGGVALLSVALSCCKAARRGRHQESVEWRRRLGGRSPRS